MHSNSPDSGAKGVLKKYGRVEKISKLLDVSLKCYINYNTLVKIIYSLLYILDNWQRFEIYSKVKKQKLSMKQSFELW